MGRLGERSHRECGVEVEVPLLPRVRLAVFQAELLLGDAELELLGEMRLVTMHNLAAVEREISHGASAPRTGRLLGSRAEALAD